MPADTLRILTFKRGLLSRVAHDLQLTLERWSWKLEGANVSARFDPRTLRVDGTVRKGRLDPRALSPKDVAEILDNTHGHVLHSARYPEITFEGRVERRAAGLGVAGTLDLHGQRRPISFTLREHKGRATGRVELQPSRWGIEPFSAMLGAIALQDRVVIELELTLPAG
jgi:hypothetical protein